MTIASARRIAVRRTDGPVGVEIKGVDLSTDLDEAAFNEIEAAYNANAVVVFRGQKLTPEQQVRFSGRFGKLEIHVLKQYLLPGCPEILVISNVTDANGNLIGLADAGRVCVWHTDMSYLEKPSRGSTLYALEVPEKDGGPLGDTLFADTAAAYDALPETMKRKLQGLKAIHRMTKGYEIDKKRSEKSVGYTQEQLRQNPDRCHPIVRTHPFTGRKCIYLNKLVVVGIEGMPDAESEPLLDELYAHCIQPQFVYRHNWRVGDLVMWDNCAAQHLATIDYELPLRRLMHRTTLAGTAPY
jgi:taurine dioxygenase